MQTLIAGFRNAKGVILLKGDYTEPKTQQSNLIANQPLELLCIDFTKVDAAKGGKENILVLTDTFSTSSQKSLIVAKLLVEKWFSILAFQPGSIVIRDGLSITRLFLIFVKCTAFANLQLHHTIPVVTLYANGSTILCLAS